MQAEARTLRNRFIDPSFGNRSRPQYLAPSLRSGGARRRPDAQGEVERVSVAQDNETSDRAQIFDEKVVFCFGILSFDFFWGFSDFLLIPVFGVLHPIDVF